MWWDSLLNTTQLWSYFSLELLLNWGGQPGITFPSLPCFKVVPREWILIRMCAKLMSLLPVLARKTYQAILPSLFLHLLTECQPSGQCWKPHVESNWWVFGCSLYYFKNFLILFYLLSPPQPGLIWEDYLQWESSHAQILLNFPNLSLYPFSPILLTMVSDMSKVHVERKKMNKGDIKEQNISLLTSVITSCYSIL